MLAQEEDVITDITLQPFMEKRLVLHECTKGRMHVYIWQHAGFTRKPEIVCLGAGLGQAIAEADLSPDMGQVIDGTRASFPTQPLNHVNGLFLLW